MGEMKKLWVAQLELLCDMYVADGATPEAAYERALRDVDYALSECLSEQIEILRNEII